MQNGCSIICALLLGSKLAMTALQLIAADFVLRQAADSAPLHVVSSKVSYFLPQVIVCHASMQCNAVCTNATKAYNMVCTTCIFRQSVCPKSPHLLTATFAMSRIIQQPHYHAIPACACTLQQTPIDCVVCLTSIISHSSACRATG